MQTGVESSARMTPLSRRQREPKQMARVCACGCSRKLIDKKGDPDYSKSRRFFDDECRNKDRKDQLKFKRADTRKEGRCSHCGQLLLTTEESAQIRRARAAHAG